MNWRRDCPYCGLIMYYEDTYNYHIWEKHEKYLDDPMYNGSEY